MLVFFCIDFILLTITNIHGWVFATDGKKRLTKQFSSGSSGGQCYWYSLDFLSVFNELLAEYFMLIN